MSISVGTGMQLEAFFFIPEKIAENAGLSHHEPSRIKIPPRT